MKRSLMTMLVAFFMMSLFSGCAVRNAEGWDPNYPQPKRKHLATQEKNDHELLRTPAYVITHKDEGLEWFEPNKFDDYVAEKKLVAPTGLQDQYEAKILELKPMQVLMSKEVKEKEAAFYALYFRINSGVNIDIQKGGLILTFRNSVGDIINVADKGCLFVSYNGILATLHDSARGTVRFNHTFNNSPDYSKMGNLVCVRIDPQYENWELVALKLEPQKISMLQ